MNGCHKMGQAELYPFVAILVW